MFREKYIAHNDNEGAFMYNKRGCYNMQCLLQGKGTIPSSWILSDPFPFLNSPLYSTELNLLFSLVNIHIWWYTCLKNDGSDVIIADHLLMKCCILDYSHVFSVTCKKALKVKKTDPELLNRGYNTAHIWIKWFQFLKFLRH